MKDIIAKCLTEQREQEPMSEGIWDLVGRFAPNFLQDYVYAKKIQNPKAQTAWVALTQHWKTMQSNVERLGADWAKVNAAISGAINEMNQAGYSKEAEELLKYFKAVDKVITDARALATPNANLNNIVLRTLNR